MDAHRERPSEASREALEEAGKRRHESCVALGPDHPHVGIGLTNLAGMRVAQDRPVDALALLRRALEVEEDHLGKTLFTGTSEQRRLRLQQFQASTDYAITLHQTHLTGSAEARALALQTLLRRKGRLADLDRDMLQGVRQRADPAGLELLDQYQRATAQLSVLQDRIPTDPAQLAAWRAQRDQLAQEVEALQRSLSARSAVFRQATRPVTVDAVAEGLPRGSALLEIAVYDPFDFRSTTWQAARYVAFVLHPDGRSASADLGPATVLEPQAEALRRRLLGPGGRSRRLVADTGSGDVGPAARALFERALRPLWDELDGVTHLYVAGGGLLTLVPFEVVISEGAPDGHRVQVSYLTSGRDLLRPQDPDEPPTAPVVVHDVDYDRAVRPEAEVPAGTGATSAGGAPAGAWQALPGAAQDL